MKTLLSILLMALFINTYAQPTFRPPPNRGEKIAVAGLVIIAIAQSGIIGRETNLTKSAAFTGGASIVLGVTIDIGGKKKHKFKIRRRR